MHVENKCKVKLSLKRQISLKEITLHFLLNLNEEFDDDLLLDAINLMFARSLFYLA